MTKFIRVSEVCGNDIFKPVLLNVDVIEHIKVGNKGTDTFIKMITPSRTDEGKGSWFFVRETVAEIEAQLSHGYVSGSKLYMDVDTGKITAE